VSTETKFVFVMAGLSVFVLIVGTFIASKLSTAPPRVIRTVWPIVAALTGACYATVVYIARLHVKG